MYSTSRLCSVIVGAMLLALPTTFAMADDPHQVNVNINVLPIASIAIIGSNLLDLTVPPSTSTVNTSGTVSFVVTGNASATVQAAPSEFVNIPGQGWLGKAVLNSGIVGYQIQLTFPSVGMMGSPIAISTLPTYDQEATVPPLTVSLLPTGQRAGKIDLLASAGWTPDGGLPLPGVYVGDIVLTVTASP